MNKVLASRTVHVSMAGLIALTTYIAVVYFAAGQADSWNIFDNENCKNPIGGAFCLITGTMSILVKVIVVGPPLALLLSGIYLKIVRFSLLSATLIPLGANILGMIAIALIAQYFSGVSLKLLAIIIPIAYLAVGVPSIRKR